ncbi:MAG: acyl-CoA dehydrogenase family protein [Dehalococcoidia bacterium]
MTATAPSVSTYLDAIQSIAPIVESGADEAERLGRLTDPVIEAFHQSRLLRVLFPERLGGGGLRFPEAMRLSEAMARVDGSAGWCLTIGIGCGVIGAWLPPASFEELASDPRAVLCGTLNPLSIRAVASGSGYQYSGKGTYASGLFYATHVLLNGIVFDGDTPRTSGPMPEIRSAIVPRARVQSLDTWSVSGLRATGSTDFAFEGIDVEERWTFLGAEGRHYDGGRRGTHDLMSSLGPGLSAVGLGIARHALDIVSAVAGQKMSLATLGSTREKPAAQIAIGRAEGLLMGARALVYEVAHEMAALEAADEPLTMEQRARNRVAAITSAQMAAEATDLAWEIAGGASIFTGTGLERCWRDIHAFTQHTLFDPGRFQTAGRIYLGLPPGSPTV